MPRKTPKCYEEGKSSNLNLAFQILSDRFLVRKNTVMYLSHHSKKAQKLKKRDEILQIEKVKSLK